MFCLNIWLGAVKAVIVMLDLKNYCLGPGAHLAKNAGDNKRMIFVMPWNRGAGLQLLRMLKLAGYAWLDLNNWVDKKGYDFQLSCKTSFTPEVIQDPGAPSQLQGLLAH